MEWHFGHNCTYYLPTMNKCRILVDKYRKRVDLLDQMWLTTEKMMVYLNIPTEQLVKEIAAGDIKVQTKKNGQLSFLVSGAWQYDDCPLAHTGGQCFYFQPHQGQKISCIRECTRLENDHPDCQRSPSQHDIENLERQVTEAIRKAENGPSKSAEACR